MEESTGFIICISPAPAKGNTWFQLLDVYCKSQGISPDDLEGMEQHEAIGELYSYLDEAIPACIDEYRRKNSWQINVGNLAESSYPSSIHTASKR